MTGALVEQDVAAADSDHDVRAGTSLWRYAARKVGGACLSLAMVVLLGFFAFRILPGDPTRSMTRGRIVSPEQLETMRRQFGLDKPLLTQFGLYLRDLPRGRLGDSYTYRRPVADLIAEHIGATLLLTGVSAAIAIGLGLWIGQRSAWRRGSWFDRLNTGTALVLWSVPDVLARPDPPARLRGHAAVAADRWLQDGRDDRDRTAAGAGTWPATW